MEDFASFIDSIRLNVNKYLKKISIPDTPRYLYDPIRYSIRDGGKRFRPILTHLSGRANNIDSDALMKLSIAPTPPLPPPQAESVRGINPIHNFLLKFFIFN